MNKIIAILLLVCLGLFSVGVVALADDASTEPQPANTDAAQVGSSGVNLYLDYSKFNLTDFSGAYSYPITIGMDYSDEFLAGAYYSMGSNYGNYSGISIPPGFSLNSYMAYFGYNIFSQDDSSIGVVATYWDANPKSDANNNEYSSLGIGLKGDLKVSPNFKLSLLYSYGLSNNIKVDSTNYTDKTYASLVDIKAIYYFSDSVGVHAVFRWNPMTSDHIGPWRLNFGSVGVGLDYKF